MPRRPVAAHATPVTRSTYSEAHAQPLVNLNTATARELERLPGIGPGLAARVVEHRTRYGPFRRAEHLLAVRGIGERRFRALRAHVTAD
ncbi:MAG TPA: helix-hairpin-helix domain-containing protein [Pyrinomonadaceae bacterium]|nr:helix-hairpin-helix domain-containing protein [Pyrinomonadaceae bacterium]